MAQYVDGYVIPIKKTNVKNYKKMAAHGCKIWMEHGALTYFECIGDDIKGGMGVNFGELCKLKPNETVVFAFIVYKSKAHRNAVNKKVYRDPRMSPETFDHMKMPFDMKRFTTGGFKTLVSKTK